MYYGTDKKISEGLRSSENCRNLVYTRLNNKNSKQRVINKDSIQLFSSKNQKNSKNSLEINQFLV